MWENNDVLMKIRFFQKIYKSTIWNPCNTLGIQKLEKGEAKGNFPSTLMGKNWFLQ